jgi:uncharacterized membrane protein
MMTIMMIMMTIIIVIIICIYLRAEMNSQETARIKINRHKNKYADENKKTRKILK